MLLPTVATPSSINHWSRKCPPNMSTSQYDRVNFQVTLSCANRNPDRRDWRKATANPNCMLWCDQGCILIPQHGERLEHSLLSLLKVQKITISFSFTKHLQQRILVILKQGHKVRLLLQSIALFRLREGRGDGGSSVLTAHRCKSPLKCQGWRSIFSLLPLFPHSMLPLLGAMCYQLHSFTLCKRCYQTQVCDLPWSRVHKDD